MMRSESIHTVLPGGLSSIHMTLKQPQQSASVVRRIWTEPRVPRCVLCLFRTACRFYFYFISIFF
jgi:hypothetical protein